MKSTSILLLTIFYITGCGSASTPVIDPPLGQHETLFKNSDPKLEALHVKAFNYDLGKGVKQDRVKANALYLKAAKAGDPRSMMNYALNIFYGKGGKIDRESAYYWIDRARFATQRSRDMKLKWRIRSFYDHVHDALSPAQRKRARSKGGL